MECLSASIPQNASVEYIAGTKAWVTWDPISGTLYDLRYRKSNDATWTEISDIATTSYVITDLDILTAYEFQVRSKCSGGLESAYSAMVNFTTTGLEYCNSSSLYPGNNFYISNVSLNTINNCI